MTRHILPLLLTACAPGTWTVEIWGEEFIETGISDMDDGCAVVFDRFLVSVSDVALLDDADEAVASAPEARVWDLVRPGPVVHATLEAPSGTWRGMRAVLGPAGASQAGNVPADALVDAAGTSLLVSGTLTCGTEAVTFTWPLDTTTTYSCDPENLVVGPGREATTQLTVHGDHLFYDSLTDPQAGLQGLVYVGADTGDGVLTKAELLAASVAPTGLDVGGLDHVVTLWDYLLAAATSVGHVDGEGHCATR